MNKTKRALLIVVIILNIINAGLNIYFAVEDIMHATKTDARLFLIFYYFLEIVGFLASAGCLIYAIMQGGKYFRERRAYYNAAVVISICMSLVSVSSILLIITLFISDMVWVKPHDDVYFSGEDINAPKQDEQLSESEKERKISKLRALRDKGVISEEEFKDELMKLL